MNFQNHAPLIIRVLTCTCTPACKNSIVGNVFAPIVRVVGLEDNPKSETIHREFTVPHYLPLRSGSFNEVVVSLTDAMGNSMKFNQGNSVAVFISRRKKKGKKYS